MNKIKWVTARETELLVEAASQSRKSLRNKLIILMLYRHGLRESELCNLRKEQVNLPEKNIFITRVKNGNSCIHPIAADELLLLKEHYHLHLSSPWLFTSVGDSKLCRDSINKLITTCYKRAGLRKITPHMLRHGCGYALINKGYDVRLIQDYLGHRDIRNTVIYTKLDSEKFRGMWGYRRGR